MGNLVLFFPGTKIFHTRFGAGIVVGCNRNHVTIDFECGGARRLDISANAPEMRDLTKDLTPSRASNNAQRSPEPRKSSRRSPAEIALIERCRASAKQIQQNCPACGHAFRNSLDREAHSNGLCPAYRSDEGSSTYADQESFESSFLQGGLCNGDGT